MIFSLAIYASPTSSQAALTALQFCRAAVEGGHKVYRVFFFHDGVYNGCASNRPGPDSADLPSAWHELGKNHDIDLVVCVSAALKRGIMDDMEARRHDAGQGNLMAGFELSGLGQLMDAATQSDRLVTFGT